MLISLEFLVPGTVDCLYPQAYHFTVAMLIHGYAVKAVSRGYYPVIMAYDDILGYLDILPDKVRQLLRVPFVKRSIYLVQHIERRRLMILDSEQER